MASHGTRAKVFNEWLRDAFTSMDEYTNTGRRKSRARKSKNAPKAKRSVAEQIKDARRQEKHKRKVPLAMMAKIDSSSHLLKATEGFKAKTKPDASRINFPRSFQNQASNKPVGQRMVSRAAVHLCEPSGPSFLKRIEKMKKQKELKAEEKRKEQELEQRIMDEARANAEAQEQRRREATRRKCIKISREVKAKAEEAKREKQEELERMFKQIQAKKRAVREAAKRTAAKAKEEAEAHKAEEQERFLAALKEFKEMEDDTLQQLMMSTARQKKPRKKTRRKKYNAIPKKVPHGVSEQPSNQDSPSKMTAQPFVDTLGSHLGATQSSSWDLFEPEPAANSKQMQDVQLLTAQTGLPFEEAQNLYLDNQADLVQAIVAFSKRSNVNL